MWIDPALHEPPGVGGTYCLAITWLPMICCGILLPSPRRTMNHRSVVTCGCAGCRAAAPATACAFRLDPPLLAGRAAPLRAAAGRGGGEVPGARGRAGRQAGGTRCLQVLLVALEALGQQQVEAADRRRYQQLMQSLRAVGRWGSRGCICSICIIHCSECMLWCCKVLGMLLHSME